MEEGEVVGEAEPDFSEENTETEKSVSLAQVRKHTHSMVLGTALTQQAYT